MPVHTYAEEKAFIMSTSVGAPLYFNDGTGLFNVMIDEMFKRLNLHYNLIHLPAQRAIVFTNNGTVDGTVPRAAAIEETQQDLIRVKVKVFDFEYMAYTKDPEIKIKDWSSLKSYNVGIINGWKIVEQNIGEPKSLVKVNDFGQLLELLDKGRIDVVILDRVMGTWKFKELGLDLYTNEPPLITKPNFLYVHKRHEVIAADITRVLHEMKKDGTYDAIFKKTLSGIRH